jgi:hypothetical protein
VKKLRVVIALILLAAVLAPLDAVASAWPSPSDTLAFSLLESVEVDHLDISLAADTVSINRQLWDLFANDAVGAKSALRK